MSMVFRELLRKVGSGTHTSKSLSREEAAAAARMMLEQQATPAQIGAFMIAHRIKRPTPVEMAGMLDTYHQLGGKIPALPDLPPPLVMGIPYDGRSRTAPLGPLTALVVSAAGYPVIQHGSGVIPTKYGVPLVELWQSLGINWSGCSLEQLQNILQQAHLAFVYQPDHFSLAESLVPYRDQIGKRPPIATLELMWAPYAGESLVAAGFVHPPTEKIIQGTLQLHGIQRCLTVKGLEGSCDLSSDRTTVIGIHGADGQTERLTLRARHYDLAAPEAAWESVTHWSIQAKLALQGEESAFTRAIVWNSGFYLWQVGLVDSLMAGCLLAKDLLASGKVAAHWQFLQAIGGRLSKTVMV